MFKTGRKIIILLLGTVLFIWVMDAVLDTIVFYKGTTLDVLVFDRIKHAIYFRVVVVTSFVIFGMLISRILVKQRKIEDALRTSEEKYRELVNTSVDGVVSVDSNMNIILWNPGAERIFGFKEKEILGKSLSEIFIKNQKDKDVFGIFRQGEIPIGKVFELEGIRKNGRRVPIEISVSSRKMDGSYIVTVIVRDITQRKKMEEELLKAKKLESIGILAGGIAHNFKNFLTAILGNITLARMSVNPKDEIYSILNEAERASLQAKNLTQQLLVFSKEGMPVRKRASISELIKESTIFVLRGSNVKCEFYILDNLWPVDVDKGQMGQVINNLVINAKEAMPEGGMIQVNAENVKIEQDKAGHQVSLNKGRYVKISIRDHGKGIPEEYLSKIFDPYFTTKEKGSGLGLATAYSIIKKHDGYIFVESKEEIGTIFYIYLPASEKEISEKKKDEEEFIVGKGRILIIDDEEIIRDVMKRMIKHIGYDVDFAKDVQEAIKIYKKALESNQPFDVVIVDLVLRAGMGAKEVLKKLIEINPYVKVIVSSGDSDNPIINNFSEYGFVDALKKPFEIKRLSEVLNKIVSN